MPVEDKLKCPDVWRRKLGIHHGEVGSQRKVSIDEEDYGDTSEPILPNDSDLIAEGKEMVINHEC